METKDVTKKETQEYLKNKELLSVAEAAKITGYSRQHVIRLINSKNITAKRVGRSFVIERKDLPGPFSAMSQKEEKEIDKAVDKVFKNYEEALKMLGKE